MAASNRRRLWYQMDVQGFNPSTYGDGFADVYDSWYGEITDPDATAAFVASRCGSGPVLELGVGSGRLVPALQRAGCDVIGFDASEPMLRRCRERLDARGVKLIQADLAELPLGRRRFAGAALCAFNTLFNLPTAEAQGRLLASLAESVVTEGAVIIEATTGSALSSGPESSVGVSRMTTDNLVLSATLLDPESQTIQGQHVEITEAGIKMRPWMLRWTSPEQLDQIAADRGLELAERLADWSGAPFTNQSETHISVYRVRRPG